MRLLAPRFEKVFKPSQPKSSGKFPTLREGWHGVERLGADESKRKSDHRCHQFGREL